MLSEDDLKLHTESKVPIVETTPLVAGGNRPTTDDQEKEATPNRKDGPLERLAKQIVWILGGFPLWVRIAKTGRRNLTVHIHELAAKSPHPIRIGDVEYSRAVVELADLEDAASISRAPRRENSLPLLAAASNPSLTNSTHSVTGVAVPRSAYYQASGPTVNQLIGKEILEKKKRLAQPTEADPQEKATWYDFMVAVFFMLFGAIAFFAGIFSIFI
jgi:hypothetical protein